MLALVDVLFFLGGIVEELPLITESWLVRFGSGTRVVG